MERYDKFHHMSIQEALRKSGVSGQEEDDWEDIARFFEEAGGSWVALAEADPNAWVLLKKCCRVYVHYKRTS